MLLVAAVALAMSAARSPTSVLAAAEFSGSLLLMLGGILGVIYGRGARRAFWVGFELFGWGYLVLAFGPWFAMEVQPHLASTRLMAELYPILHSSPPSAKTFAYVKDMDLYSYAYRDYDTLVMWERNRMNFIRSGHAAFAQLLALAGGFLARRLYVTQNATARVTGARDDLPFAT